MAAILPWTVFLTTLPTIGWICSPLTITLREEQIHPIVGNDWVDLLTIDNNFEGRALWDNLGLSDTRKDLNHLLLARDSLGGDSNWDMLGAVHEENVLAIVDLVREGHVVKGADNRWLNTAGSWNMVASQLKGSNLQWGGEDGSWEDRQWAEDSHQTEVLQDDLPGWGL